MLAHQERRRSARIRLTRSSPYEYSSINGDAIEWFHGDALSINISLGGMLLLMPDQPRHGQVVQVRGPADAEPEIATQIAEVSWTRGIPFGDEVTMYLVGLKFMFQIPLSEC